MISCAAYTNVDKAEDNEEAAFMINALAVANLANACAAHNAILFQVSTDYIFSGNRYIPYIKEDATEPLGVYGKSKGEGEETLIHSGCSL